MGTAVLRLEIVHFQQALIVLLASHLDGDQAKVGDVTNLSSPCRPLGHFLVGAANRTLLANIWRGILITWTNQRNRLSIRRSGSLFRTLRNSQLGTSRTIHDQR